MNVSERLQQSASQERRTQLLNVYRLGKEKFIEYAEIERRRGYSHRTPPFQVGCSLLVDSSGGPLFKGNYDVYSAFNFTKPPGNKKGSDKRCAERNAIEDALADGGTIIAIVTLSREVSTGGEENKSQDVLHPCRECRDMMRELIARGILPGETIICNVNSSKKHSGGGEWVEEERTVDELLALYHDDQGKFQPQGLFYLSAVDRATLDERIRVKKSLLNLRFTAIRSLD